MAPQVKSCGPPCASLLAIPDLVDRVEASQLEQAFGGRLTIIPSVMNRTRAAVMWMAKKEHGAPRKFFLWQQLNRSSCPEGGTQNGRAESTSAPCPLLTQSGQSRQGLLAAVTSSSLQVPVRSSHLFFAHF